MQDQTAAARRAADRARPAAPRPRAAAAGAADRIAAPGAPAAAGAEHRPAAPPGPPAAGAGLDVGAGTRVTLPAAPPGPAPAEAGTGDGPAVTRAQVAALYGRGLLDLVFEAAAIHRRHHDPAAVQCSSLLSVKTGGCPEDCGYCPQSAHYAAGVEAAPLLRVDEVRTAAARAQAGGADRFCIGAAWRQAADGPAFDRVLEMVAAVKALGLETCATLGMLDRWQAARLRAAGLDYYNHNLDTGRAFYGSIVTTRTYDDRLATLRRVRDAGIKVCCGGILGLGEGPADRIDLLQALAGQRPQPESVPINTLVAVDGTPLADAAPVAWDDVVRVIAVARILMPAAAVRLSAGRLEMAPATQALCFLAGANSIFLGDRLLTTPNPEPGEDAALLARLGLRAAAAAPPDA